MIHNNEEYLATLERIVFFQKQAARIREVEVNSENYHLSASGYLAELDRMNLEIREYLWSLPGQLENNRKSA